MGRREVPLILFFIFLGLTSSFLICLSAAEEISLSPRVILKFSEGLEVKVLEGRVSGKVSSAPQSSKLLGHKELDTEKIEDGFNDFNDILEAADVLGIERLFSHKAQGLQPEGPRPGERNLELYYSVAFKNVPMDDIEAFIQKVRDLPILEIVYQAAIPENAVIKQPS